MHLKVAKEIDVRAFRHIVMWPALLRGQPDKKLGDESALQPWVDEFTREGKWREELAFDSDKGDADYDRAPGVHSRFSYEQIVYFHPFVRDFLFGDGTEKLRNRSTRLLTRRDVRGVEVELGNWQPEGVRLRLSVTRTELYLCKPCVAILVVEVAEPRYKDNTQPVKLDVLQDFTDQFRRLYPPFWWDSGEPGLCLRRLTWLDETGEPIDVAGCAPDPGPDQDSHNAEPALKRGLADPKANYDAFTRKGAEPPLFNHWQWLFGETVRPAQTQKHIRPPTKSDPAGLWLQQLMDERMPVMSYFAVDDPAEVSEGDHDRLAFVDASGSDPYPYQEQFLAERRKTYSYERFAHYGTRYFCSGYGFSMIGPAEDFHYGKILPNHFSHHYFSLGLIAHFQRAALLYFADELAHSVKDLAGKPIEQELSSHDFRSHVETIQHRFLKFRSRAYFPEVTNQLQGRELFELWFDALETERLFQLVDSASERLTSVLAERESRLLARVAGKSIPWGIALAVASVMFSAGSSLNLVRNWGNAPDWLFWSIVLCSVVVGFVTRWLLKTDHACRSLWQFLRTLWKRITN